MGYNNMKKMILIMMAFFSVFTLSACGKDTTKKEPEPNHEEYEVYSLLDSEWIDQNKVDKDTTNKYRGQASYTINQDNDILEVTPHKYHKEDGITVDLRNVDLTKYKSLVFTGKGDGILSLTINSTRYITNGKNTIKYPLTMIEDTFIFKLDFEGYEPMLETIESITLVFGSDVVENEEDLNKTPAVHSPIGKSEISRFEFTTEEADMALTFNVQGTVYDPDANLNAPDSVNVLSDFSVYDEDSYLLDYVDGNLDLTTTTSKDVWSYVYKTLEGNFKPYTKLVIEVQGDAGAKFKLKLEGDNITNYETGNTNNKNMEDITLNGELQTFVWYIPEESLTDGDLIMLLLFFEPGVQGTGVNMTISKLEFQK